MFGTLRYLLATLVVLSHNNITLYGKNIGVMAVVVFYLLSGYMMTGLIRRRYDRLSAIAGFYADRFLRIYPQYALFLALTFALTQLLAIHNNYLHPFFPSPWEILANIGVIPLNYFMFNHTDGYMLMPQAWSLGAELQFYLLFPFILLLHRHLRVWLASLSVGIFSCAMFGWLHTDWYGYRLLPGVLFIFLTGSLIYDRQRYAIIGLWLAVLGIAIGCYVQGVPYRAFNVEVMVGFLLGVAVVLVLRHGSQRRWDDYLGHLSYGVFLCHFLVIWVIQTMAHLTGQFSQLVVVVVVASLLGSAGYHAVESPVLQWRKKRRGQ
jgi:peptidoglycan/LPS O-acetylase OafA/YrhL